MNPIKQYSDLYGFSQGEIQPNSLNRASTIDDNSAIEKTYNFERSATVNYLINWSAKNLQKTNDDIEYYTKNINKLQKEIEIVVASSDDRELEDLQDQLVRRSKLLDKMMEHKNNLIVMGTIFQSEWQIKSLVANFLKTSSLYSNKELDDSTWNIFWEMIKREAEYGDDYYVIYTSHDKDVEVGMLNNHIENAASGHVCKCECFINKAFRKIGELEFTTLEDIYTHHIFTEKFVNDHATIMKTHFICANLTLFGNCDNAESTIERFWRKYQMSKVAASDNPLLKAKMKALEQLQHGVLEQIFIRKDVATQIGYVSAPYGFPLTSSLNVLENSTTNILEAFQNGAEIDIETIDAKYILNEKQFRALGNYSRVDPISTQEFLKENGLQFKDLQYRLMYIPKLYNDKSSVLVFSNTDNFSSSLF